MNSQLNIQKNVAGGKTKEYAQVLIKKLLILLASPNHSNLAHQQPKPRTVCLLTTKFLANKLNKIQY